MTDIRIYQPSIGIDSSQTVNMIDDRAAVDGTSNVDFDDGAIVPPSGFIKLSGGSALAGKVFGITQYQEINGQVDLVVASSSKTYVHDISNDDWDEITGATLDADMFYPVSFANIIHQDSVGGAYQHLLICDGGNSDIKRWSGIGTAAAALSGGAGYHATTQNAHRALQVCSYQNRAILISPQEYDGGVWLPNPSRIRWPQQAKLETWTGTGSGFVDLIDTGDTNVAGVLLGNTLIIYQKHSTWQLRYVGGTTVFTPDILLQNLGLLSYQTIVSLDGIHYFVGHDYNVYSFSGGNSPVDIGKPISKLLMEDISSVGLHGCRMAFSAQHKYLWIFIVQDGSNYAVKSYKLNLKNGAWTVRDFSAKYPAGGITAAKLVGGSVYAIGQSYDDAITETTTYAQAMLEIPTTETETATTWDITGKIMTGSGSKWKSGVNLVEAGDTVEIISGTNATPGLYIVDTVTSDTVMSLTTSIGSSPTPTGVDYDIFNLDAADTYDDVIEEVRTDEKLTIGDSSGYVYQEDASVTADDGVEPSHYYYTKEFDGGAPEMSKRIDCISVDAKGTSITIEYSIDGGAWVNCFNAVSLTSEYKPYRRFINRKAKKIQFRMSGLFSLRSWSIINAMPEDNR